MHHTFLQSTTKQFEYYKVLGEKTIDQIEDGPALIISTNRQG